ncbi:hypothetical protein [Nocardia transvalensis]|uniref:hypothetical protein n=1 Tax=Nocardia transvalensis TaxID=37333 RepID=UPI00189508F5|nr:hypothetical protein [Nocardia transvalensis]MBF6331818.1 hypothetical protein [Nocardia transvalensis]
MSSTNWVTPMPTPRQVKMLKAIHAQQMTERKGAFGRDRGAQSASWDEQRVADARLVRELENVAAAAGVPREWIEQARERGASGLPWNTRLNWRVPEPVERADVLATLAADVRQVQELATLVAAYGDEGRLREVGTAQLIDRKLRILGQRVAALAWALDITASEAERLWGAESHWTAATASVRSASATSVAERWRAHARSDTTSLDLQATALAKCGLTGKHAEHGPPTPEEVVQVARNLLTPTPTTAAAPTATEDNVAHGPDDGRAIGAAIAAVEFSAAPEPEAPVTAPTALPPRDPFALPELEP